MTEWYYADAAGNRVGPLGAEQLAQAHAQGRLKPATLVWREGLADWVQWRTVQHEVVPPAAVPPTAPAADAPPPPPTFDARPAAPVATPSYAAPAAAAGVVVQGGHVVYAGFWKRVAASIIDGVVLWFVMFALQMVLMMLAAGLGALSGVDRWMNGGFDLLMAVIYIVTLLVYSLYFASMHASSMQATIGKLAVGIKVVNTEGGRIGFLHAFIRWWAYLLAALPFCLGLLIAAFTEGKRALHDYLCSTLVVDRHAFTHQPELQNEQLGIVTWIVLVLAGLCLVLVVGFIVVLMIAFGGGGGWH